MEGARSQRDTESMRYIERIGGEKHMKRQNLESNLMDGRSQQKQPSIP